MIRFQVSLFHMAAQTLFPLKILLCPAGNGAKLFIIIGIFPGISGPQSGDPGLFSHIHILGQAVSHISDFRRCTALLPAYIQQHVHIGLFVRTVRTFSLEP